MIYVSTSLLNIERAKEIIDRLKLNGVQITYDWTTHGEIIDYDKLKICAQNEYDGIVNSKCLFFITPGRYSSHIEFGIALALKKPIILLIDGGFELQPFYLLNGVIMFDNEDQAINCAINLIKG